MCTRWNVGDNRSACDRNAIFVSGASASSPLMYCSKRRATATRGELVDRHRRVGNHAAGKAAVDAQHVAERSLFRQLRRDPAGIETNGPHPHGDLVVQHLEAGRQRRTRRQRPGRGGSRSRDSGCVTGGTRMRSNARSRSSRRIDGVPSAARSSVSSTADASLSQ